MFTIRNQMNSAMIKDFPLVLTAAVLATQAVAEEIMPLDSGG